MCSGIEEGTHRNSSHESGSKHRNVSFGASLDLGRLWQGHKLIHTVKKVKFVHVRKSIHQTNLLKKVLLIILIIIKIMTMTRQ